MDTRHHVGVFRRVGGHRPVRGQLAPRGPSMERPCLHAHIQPSDWAIGRDRGGGPWRASDHDQRCGRAAVAVVATFLSPPDKTYWIRLTDQGRRRASGGGSVANRSSMRGWQAGEPNNVKHVDPVTGQLPGEHHGVINWHLIYDPARARVGSWNDYTSIPERTDSPGSTASWNSRRTRGSGIGFHLSAVSCPESEAPSHCA